MKLLVQPVSWRSGRPVTVSEVHQELHKTAMWLETPPLKFGLLIFPPTGGAESTRLFSLD